VPSEVPNEVVMARLSIQVALVALESLFEKLNVSSRTQKVIASAEVTEACQRLKAAQELLVRLESEVAAADLTKATAD
jgi:hypothetical protein